MRAGRIEHDGDPVSNGASATSSAATMPGSNVYPRKFPAEQKIDARWR